MKAPTLGKEAKRFLPKSHGFIYMQHVLLKSHLFYPHKAFSSIT